MTYLKRIQDDGIDVQSGHDLESKYRCLILQTTTASIPNASVVIQILNSQKYYYCPKIYEPAAIHKMGIEMDADASSKNNNSLKVYGQN